MHNKLLMRLMLPLKMQKYIIVMCLFHWISYCSTQTIPPSINVSTTHHNELSQEIAFTFAIPKKDFLYKDFISFTIADPRVVISPWKADRHAITYYDPLFKGTKEIFKTHTTITITLSTESLITEPLHLYCSYYQRSEKKIKQFVLPVSFLTNQTLSDSQESLQTHLDTNGMQEKTKQTTTLSFNGYIQHILNSWYNLYASTSWPVSTHVMFVATIILFVLLLSYMLYKKMFLDNHLQHSVTMCVISLCFVLLLYILHQGFYIVRPLIMLPLSTISFIGIGMFYIKKSTYITHGHMRSFCTICGCVCISLSVLLMFKLLQLCM